MDKHTPVLVAETLAALALEADGYGEDDDVRVDPLADLPAGALVGPFNALSLTQGSGSRGFAARAVTHVSNGHRWPCAGNCTPAARRAVLEMFVTV